MATNPGKKHIHKRVYSKIKLQQQEQIKSAVCKEKPCPIFLCPSLLSRLANLLRVQTTYRKYKEMYLCVNKREQ